MTIRYNFFHSVKKAPHPLCPKQADIPIFAVFTLKFEQEHYFDYRGPVVQSIVSLTGVLVVKMLTVLLSKISNSQVFLLKKM